LAACRNEFAPKGVFGSEINWRPRPIRQGALAKCRALRSSFID
jgi:hypothetical protein